MASSSLPLTTFDTTAMPAAESFDLWREVLRGGYDLTAADRARPSLRIATGMWEAERLVMAYCRSEAARVDRRGALAGRSGRFLKLRWFSRGAVRLVHGAETTVIGPGAIHLIDQSREIVEISSAHEQRTIFLPHAAVGFDPARHPVWIRFPLDAAVGRVLADALTLFFAQLPRAEAREAPALEAGLIGLLRGLLSGALESAAEESVAAARAAAMKRYLDGHLRVPGLGVANLLEAFGAARSTIFRDFQAVGGVRRYILDQRLERAFAELARHPGRRGIVGEVAEAWGFESVCHFSRVFRSRYGFPPGEAVGRDLRGEEAESAPPPPAPPPGPKAIETDPEALARVYQRITGTWG